MALHLNHGTLDLTATDLDIRQVLEALFHQLDARAAIAPEVQGRVTLDLHNVTFEQALLHLLEPLYTYHIGPHDVIYVHRAGTSWAPGNPHID
jgi:type II secretory pathway component GspD/PulD (secretin)